ncbi:MAG: hypothetical protein WCP82_08465 [Alphaproteobacteria bacterium]
MTTARSIITGALTQHLNRLSPGESLDADVAAVALDGLNFIADEWNGSKSFLFRELLTASSAISAATGTLGTTWAGLASGDEILGATVAYSATLDVPLEPITMAQYQQIAIKSLTTYPAYYAHDGAATVYLYPVPTGQTITLRTKQIVSDFADLDTDYSMPKGYKSALAAVLAEKLAPVMLGGISPAVAAAAKAARSRIYAQAINPAIINGRAYVGPVARIRRGF